MTQSVRPIWVLLVIVAAVVGVSMMWPSGDSPAPEAIATPGATPAVVATSPSFVGPSVSDGIHTVGSDIVPGTYATVDPTDDQCYWWVYKSGVPADKILDHVVSVGAHESGRQTVELKDGETWQIHHCGTWQRLASS